MMNKLCTLLGLSLLLFTACGDSSNSSPIYQQKFLIIHTGLPADTCESIEYKTILTNLGFVDFITQETNNDTSCDKYGRLNDNFTCTIIPHKGYSKNCSIGYNDLVRGNYTLGEDASLINGYF